MTRRRAALAAGLLVGVAALAGGVVALQRGGTTPTAAMATPRFVEETGPSGLAHVYGGDSRFFVGGGVATFDCDDDGFPELYLAGGAQSAALFRNASTVGGPLRFERVADPATDLVDVTGAYPIDLDSDGTTDLAVLRAGENVLMRGLGDCRFQRANEAWAFDGADERSMAFSATWEGTSALPTLAVGDYIALDAIGNPEPPCPGNTLFRPAGPSVEDGYGAAIPLAPGYCPLSMLFSDWDRSGRRDLRISNDRQYYTDGLEQLWRIAPGEAPRLYTAEDGWVSMQIWGMGIASHDLTDDGYPEVYLTSQGDNKLQTLTAGPATPTYRDIALRRGVTAAQPSTGGETLPSTAWHPEFVDVNADGFIDLLVTKGNVSAQVGYATKDPTELLMGRPDGTFQQGATDAGIVRFERGRGASLADLNLDGLPDYLLVNLDAPVELWRNLGSGLADRSEPLGNWLFVRPRQPGPNVDAVGAWLEVKVGEQVQRRELVVGGGHLSGHLGWLHVGLGPSSSAEVRVLWPDGEVGAWQRLDAGTFHYLDRGVAAPVPWTP